MQKVETWNEIFQMLAKYYMIAIPVLLAMLKGWKDYLKSQEVNAKENSLGFTKVREFEERLDKNEHAVLLAKNDCHDLRENHSKIDVRFEALRKTWEDFMNYQLRQAQEGRSKL